MVVKGIRTFIFWFNMIISKGTRIEDDIWTISRNKLLNLLAIFSSLSLFIFAFINAVLKNSLILVLFYILAAIYFILPFVLSSFKKHVSAKITFIFFAYFTVFFSVMMFGDTAYFHFYLVPLVAIPIILFQNEIGLWKWVLSIIGYPVWIFLKIWSTNNNPFFQVNYLQFLRITNVSIIFIATIVFVYIFDRHIKRNHQLISDMNDELYKLSITDSLTNLFNGRHIFKELKKQFDKRFDEAEQLFFAIFDVDKFKLINDDYGHDYGDFVLKEIAILASRVFKNDTVGRIGGDEFCVIFFDKKYHDIKKNINAFNKELKVNEFNYNGIINSISVSIGVSKRTMYMKSSKDLFKAADVELYISKKDKNKLID